MRWAVTRWNSIGRRITSWEWSCLTRSAASSWMRMSLSVFFFVHMSVYLSMCWCVVSGLPCWLLCFFFARFADFFCCMLWCSKLSSNAAVLHRSCCSEFNNSSWHFSARPLTAVGLYHIWINSIIPVNSGVVEYDWTDPWPTFMSFVLHNPLKVN